MSRIAPFAAALALFVATTTITEAAPIRPAIGSLAGGTTVTDAYWGKGPAVYDGTQGVPYGSYANRDVIGDASVFDVKGFTWALSGSILTLRIDTNYPSGGADGTFAGDLFLATGGWNPCGTLATHYACDDLASTGTLWNYGIRTSDGRLFGLGNPGSIATSDAVFGATHAANAWIYRGNQPVAIGASAVDLGTGSSNSNAGSLTYAIDLNAIGNPTSLAVSWAMSCGNDVVQGVVGVPEPGTLVLMALGLAGLALARGAGRAERAPRRLRD